MIYSFILGSLNNLNQENTPELKMNLLFVGLIILLFGIIFIFELKSLSVLLQKVFNKIYTRIKNEERLHIYFLILIIITGVILRIVFLSKPIRYLEAFSFINYVSLPLFNNIFDSYSISNHVFNNMLVNISKMFFGTNLLTIRFPSFLFGSMLIPMTYLVARSFYNKNTALLSSAIAAASPFLIIYSTDSRGISLIIFLFLFILLIAKFLKDKDDIFAWLLFTLIATLGFYTSPLFILPYSIVIIWLVLSMIFKDTRIKRMLLFKRVITYTTATFILCFLFYIPLFVTGGYRKYLQSKFFTNFFKNKYF